MAQTVFLTGASSGIGRAAAELFAERGFEVWATARDTSRVPNHPLIHALDLDLERPSSIDGAWTRALSAAGHLDVVIQNAGAGIFGAIEDVTPDEAARQWQILVAGPLQLFRLAAAHLRPRRAGVIVGVSSLAAELPLPFAAHYSAGKAALSALLGGLAMELEPFGVRVVDLRPGDIRTAFNDHIAPASPTGSAYAPWMAAAWKETRILMDAAPEPGYGRARHSWRGGTAARDCALRDFFPGQARRARRALSAAALPAPVDPPLLPARAGGSPKRKGVMKRLLVLTSATGAGHDTHALATAAWCARLYGTYIQVTIAHALEDSHGSIGWASISTISSNAGRRGFITSIIT